MLRFSTSCGDVSLSTFIDNVESPKVFSVFPIAYSFFILNFLIFIP